MNKAIHRPDFRVTHLAGAIGAEIDLRSLDADTFDRIHQAFLTHLILVFPHQSLTAEDQTAFARRFGDLYQFPHGPGITDNPDILPINMPSGLLKGRWHSDATFDERPPAISILAAKELPSRGGETAFANQYAAFETLSPGMQRLVSGLHAVHDATSHGRPNEVATHPVVRIHPETGRPALFVNAEFTRRFAHMTRAESAGLLDYLTTHAHQPEFCYFHRWRVGDVVMWDNRAAQHYPVMNRPQGETRRMWRVTVAGERPIGPETTSAPVEKTIDA
jgi:taurine dioxygenase